MKSALFVVAQWRTQSAQKNQPIKQTRTAGLYRRMGNNLPLKNRLPYGSHTPIPVPEVDENSPPFSTSNFGQMLVACKDNRPCNQTDAQLARNTPKSVYIPRLGARLRRPVLYPTELRGHSHNYREPLNIAGVGCHVLAIVQLIQGEIFVEHIS